MSSGAVIVGEKAGQDPTRTSRTPGVSGADLRLSRSAAPLELPTLASLDERLDLDGVRLGMAVTHDGVRPSTGLDDDVRENEMRVDFDGGNVRDVNRLLLLADPPWRVLHDASRRDRDLRGEETVPAGPPTGAEHVALHERPPLAVDDGNEYRHDERDDDQAAHDPGH